MSGLRTNVSTHAVGLSPLDSTNSTMRGRLSFREAHRLNTGTISSLGPSSQGMSRAKSPALVCLCSSPTESSSKRIPCRAKSALGIPTNNEEIPTLRFISKSLTFRFPPPIHRLRDAFTANGGVLEDRGFQTRRVRCEAIGVARNLGFLHLAPFRSRLRKYGTLNGFTGCE